MNLSKTKKPPLCLLPEVTIAGSGIYLPSRVLTNYDLEKMVNTTDQWITERTGIKERRIAGEKETPSEMGSMAAIMALQNAGLSAEDLDLIIVATTTPDTIFPSTACHIQHKIGARTIPAFDIQAACSGFIYGFVLASQFIASGNARNILLVGAEKLSSIVNWEDRNTCVLFGDGAGALIISNNKNKDCQLSFDIGADGSHWQILFIPAGGSRLPLTSQNINHKLHFIHMVGKKVFKLAIDSMEKSLKRCLEKAGVSADQLSCIIPHQANLRIIEALSERLHIPAEKFFVNMEKYGNTSSACIPIAFHEAITSKRIKDGDVVLLVSFGAGITWGSILFRYKSQA
ncbi:beta-ketoacyl-ACP synthase III [Methylacidiphilum caldifontis]|uniref:Beta-ketoacyl-[acyl-carrier-protein] synthase III n=1 Tax=Methylacidiphilum caldifontis TaxID=2795386 RepID=A0A4Y8P7C9_9BACT|nr:beta-ketoacyl-ACP synthase III [Methylacidiphilum caldifontis]QSR88874.1 ketoacyl-ACP synthase III [Methylacidiphilum caldifontis]TFE66216.1 3-oxoacyl-ACP synthase [Methylacidiphilum caldifontis]